MSVGRFLQQAAAGNAGGAVYVDDVFSTYLYTGNGSTQTITNGINLDGEGGMLWIKNRDAAVNHQIHDTERGASVGLNTNNSNAEYTDANAITSFNSDGFSMNNNYNSHNQSGVDFVSWTFRKQPGFFDVVTYTGDGTSNRNISHSLDSAPGAILIKRTDSASSTGWMVWHRSGSPQSGTYGLMLNYANGWGNIGADIWGTSGPNMTSTTFSVGNYSDVNASGGTYVAYIFAHDAQDFGTGSDESIVYCGTYEGNGSTKAVTLGWEPQWCLIKNVDDSTNDWQMFDTMRGAPYKGDTQFLNANDDGAEAVGGGLGSVKWYPTSTGFEVGVGGGGANDPNENNETYIYVAIRRPHKPAEEFAATDLFTTVVGTGNPPPNHISGFPVDAYFFRQPDQIRTTEFASRLQGDKRLFTDTTAAESSNSDVAFDFSNGVHQGGYSSTHTTWMFRRAPGFFDVVAYTGSVASDTNLTPTSYAHNLNVAPELIIVKTRNRGINWFVWHKDITSGYFLRLNLINGITTASGDNPFVSGVVQSADNFQISGVINNSGYNYITYLFATVPGISKVGSYTGTGANVDVNCGFTSGARFVLVKRTDSSGDWYLWDSVRGIVAGNDPYLFLNTTAAQAYGTDFIDPLSSGFTITSSAAVNASGGNYIFLAIA